jgi:hypothetical protein
MTITMQQDRSSKAGLVLFFIAIFLAVLISVGITYGAIPSTEHALEKHAGEKWNAITIADFYDAGGCKPKIYDCGHQELHICEQPGGKALGLIISTITGKKVTGFKATSAYWNAQTKGCNGYAH